MGKKRQHRGICNGWKNVVEGKQDEKSERLKGRGDGWEEDWK